MAKGDKVTVKSEIGGTLQSDEILVTGAGGTVEVEMKKDWLTVSILGRTGKTRERFQYALGAVRSITEKRRDDD